MNLIHRFAVPLPRRGRLCVSLRRYMPDAHDTGDSPAVSQPRGCATGDSPRYRLRVRAVNLIHRFAVPLPRRGRLL